MTKVFKNFEADTGKILNIVINSLYSDREIFLRELLSNASDAIQKRRYLGQTEPALLNSGEDRITLRVNAKKKILEIETRVLVLAKQNWKKRWELWQNLVQRVFSRSWKVLKKTKTPQEALLANLGLGFIPPLWWLKKWRC